jgi:hypothetical protein
METNEENLDNEEQEKELNLEGGEKNEEGPTMHTITRKKSKNRRGNGGDTFNKGENVADRIPKESKLATRGGNIIKGKTGAVMKRGVENVVDKFGVEVIEDLVGKSLQPNKSNTQSIEKDKHMEENDMGRISANMMGPKHVSNPNMPRPPDKKDTHHAPPTMSKFLIHNEDLATEGDVFEDANDQGTNLSSDSEMDFVVETPNIGQ